ncbi:MAG: hypothetical protein ACLQMS_16995 [Desulfomonilaceae bacterium]
MKKRFVVCVDSPTRQQEDSITLFFEKEDSLNYWHWFSHSWLVVAREDDWTTKSLRKTLNDIVPGVSIIVLQIENGKWSIKGDKKSFNWLHETWSGD